MVGGMDTASEALPLNAFETVQINLKKKYFASDMQVTDAIQLSRATLNKIRQNLCWALGYNLVGGATGVDT